MFFYDTRVHHHPCFPQSHSSLENWPKLIPSVTKILEKSDGSIHLPVVGPGLNAEDVQLSRCFQNLCTVTHRVHKNNLFHNFACAGFHLCYILKVRACPVHASGLDQCFCREGFTSPKIKLPWRQSCVVAVLSLETTFHSLQRSSKRR